MIRVLLLAAFSALFVSCASIAPEIDRSRTDTAWAKKDENAAKAGKNVDKDERSLVKSNEYQPGWQF